MKIKLITGTNKETVSMIKILNDIPKLKSFIWLSNKFETAHHYYEGGILEFTIDFDTNRMDYIKDDTINIPEDYTYGAITTEVPRDGTNGCSHPGDKINNYIADWYSISRQYLITHTTEIRNLTLEECEKLY